MILDDLFESAQPQKLDLTEGVMDRLRRIYMGLVYDRPWGTPDSEFINQWQREIKDQLGLDIDWETLYKLQQNFRERGRSMIGRGDVEDWHREMGIREQGVAGGSSSQIKRYSGPPEGYTFSRVQQKNYDMLVDILARNGIKFTRIDAETYPGRRSYYDRIGKSTPIMLTSFIGRSPALEWYKYEGQTAGGGTNTVKVGGKKMKLTDFLRLKPEQQDALLKSGPGQGVAEAIPSHIRPSDIPPGQRARLTMKDIEAERPQGAFRFRVTPKASGESPRDFLDRSAAEAHARAVGGRVEPIREREESNQPSRSARIQRILQQMRARYPQAEDDLEALILNFRSEQNQDRQDISTLYSENDTEEDRIERIERLLQDLKQQRGLAEKRDRTDINQCYNQVGTK